MRNRIGVIIAALVTVLFGGLLLPNAAQAAPGCTTIRSEPTSVGYVSVDLKKGAPFQEEFRLYPGQQWEGCGENQPIYYKLTRGFGTRVDVYQIPGNPNFVRNGSTDGVEPGWYSDFPDQTFTNMILVRV